MKHLICPAFLTTTSAYLVWGFASNTIPESILWVRILEAIAFGCLAITALYCFITTLMEMKSE